MKTPKEFIAYFLTSKHSRQAAYLYGSQIAVLVSGMLISSFNTRFLGPSSFGIYATVLAVSEFVLLFIDFGFFSSGARVIALKDSGVKSRQMVGFLIIITIALSLLSAVILFGLSFFVDRILKEDIGGIVKMFSIFIGFSLFNMIVEAICRGSNHIERFSFFNVFNRILYLVLIVIFFFLGHYNLYLAILFNFLSLFVASFLILRYFNPLWNNISGNLAEVIADIKVYGFKAYIGNIASTASYRTDSLMLSYFAGTTTVGYYRLGNLLTFPMVNFSRSISTTLFRKFAVSNCIQKKVLLVNFYWLLAGCLGLILVGKFAIFIMFGEKYTPVNQLIPPLAFTAFFAGLSVPYNMYLGAKGMGSFLQRTALILTFFNLTFNILLIPKYKALGASYASMLALGINLILHIYYYNKTVAEGSVVNVKI